MMMMMMMMKVIPAVGYGTDNLLVGRMRGIYGLSDSRYRCHGPILVRGDLVGY